MPTFLSFSLVILLVVFFHELGHFIVARACGIQVKAFSVGIGPKLLSRTDKHGTEWKLCLLPLGGYVQMLEGEKTKNFKQSFESKTILQRLAVVLAGPIASLLLGWVLFFGVFSVFGTKEAPQFNIEGIGEVQAGSPADKAGLRIGDVITNISYASKSEKIDGFYDVYVAVQNAGKRPMKITIRRGDDIKILNGTSRAILDEKTDKIVYRLGFKAKPLKNVKITVLDSFTKANRVTIMSLTAIYDGVLEMFNNGIGENMGGPIKIAQVSGEAGRAGIEYLLGFIAMLSINLAVINMLPLPIMDGGRVLLLIIEGGIGRPLPKKIVGAIMMASVWFMLFFFVFITLKDLNVF